MSAIKMSRYGGVSLERADWSAFQVASLPTGTFGGAVIARATVNAKEAEVQKLEAFLQGMKGHPMTPPTEGQVITTLHVGGALMMSDTYDEVRDHWEPLNWAWRDNGYTSALIAGLGLGVVARGMALAPSMERITVLEMSYDVIALVAPWLRRECPDVEWEFRHCDALEHRPAKGERHDCAWFDIWPDISTQNLPDMAVLHRRWCRRVQDYGSWKHAELRYHRDRERRAGW